MGENIPITTMTEARENLGKVVKVVMPKNGKNGGVNPARFAVLDKHPDPKMQQRGFLGLFLEKGHVDFVLAINSTHFNVYQPHGRFSLEVVGNKAAIKGKKFSKGKQPR